MASTAQLGITIAAKDSASAILGNISNKAHGLGSAFGTALKIGAAGAAIGIGAATAAAVSFLKAAADEQIGIERLKTAVENAGVSWVEQGDAIEALIKEREKLAFSDDELRDSLSTLVAQTDSLEEAQNRQALAMDLARGSGMDLQTASTLLGKVTEDNVNVLKRYGISVKEGATQEELLAAVHKKFAGQSAAFAKTVPGQWKIITNQISNVKEALGAGLLPVATKVFGAIGTFLIDHMADFERLGQVIADVAEKGFEKLANIATSLKDIWDANQPLLTSLGDLATAVGSKVITDFQETILPGIKDVLEKLAGPLSTVVGYFKGLFDKLGAGGGGASKVDAVAKAVEIFLGLLTAAALISLGTFVVGIAATAINFALMPLKAIWETGAAIKNFVTEAAKMVSKAVTITQNIAHTGASIITGLVDTIQTITQKVVRTGSAWITDFKNKVQTITQKVKVEAPGVQDQGKVAGTAVSKGIIAGFVAHFGKVFPNIIGAAIGGGLVTAIVALKAATVTAAAVTFAGVVAGVIASAIIVAGMLAWPVAIGYALYRAFTDAIPSLFKAIADVDWAEVGHKILYGLGYAATLVAVGLAEYFILIPLAVTAFIAQKFKDFGVWLWNAISPSLTTFATETVPDFFTETIPKWAATAAGAVAAAFPAFGQWITDAALPGIGTFITTTLPDAFTVGIPTILTKVATAAWDIGTNILSGIAQGLADLIFDPTGMLTSWIVNPFVIGAVGVAGDLLRLGTTIGGNIVGGIGDALRAAGAAIGADIIKGIQDAWEWAQEHDPTGLLKHLSPSQAGVEVGQAFAAGIGKGIAQGASHLVGSLDNIAAALTVPSAQFARAGETIVPAGRSLPAARPNVTVQVGVLAGDRASMDRLTQYLDTYYVRKSDLR